MAPSIDAFLDGVVRHKDTGNETCELFFLSWLRCVWDVDGLKPSPFHLDAVRPQRALGRQCAQSLRSGQPKRTLKCFRTLLLFCACVRIHLLTRRNNTFVTLLKRVSIFVRYKPSIVHVPSVVTTNFCTILASKVGTRALTFSNRELLLQTNWGNRCTSLAFLRFEKIETHFERCPLRVWPAFQRANWMGPKLTCIFLAAQVRVYIWRWRLKSKHQQQRAWISV